LDINAYIESGVIESYVLGLASAEEAAELEALAAQYAEIKSAVNEFEILIQKTITEEGIAPPVELKQQIMNALADEFEQPKVIAMPAANTGKSNNEGQTKVVQITTPGAWRTIAVAASVLFVVSAGLNYYYYNNYKAATNSYEALLENQKNLQAFETKYNSLQSTINILQDSAMHVVKMQGAKEKAGDIATVYWDTRTKDVYLLANKMPPAPAGKQYQLWAIVDGKPVDAGLMSDCDGVCKMKNIPAAQAFAITLEDAGGSPTPHLDQLFVIGKA